MSSEEKLDRALKAYLKSKGVNAGHVWVDSETETYREGGCETCYSTEVKIKYTLYWKSYYTDWYPEGFEAFSDMADLMRIAVEFSE